MSTRPSKSLRVETRSYPEQFTATGIFRPDDLAIATDSATAGAKCIGVTRFILFAPCS